ncbi:MAG: LmbE family protein [Gemmataceae bacterium]|nr:LmbE family protein [Gemmataceae bacterium]
MRMNFSDERVLAITAHPDDAELLCAGALLRAREEGAQTAICIMCNGDKGQTTPAVDNLAALRAEEAAASAQFLGAQLFLLGLPDSLLQEDEKTRLALVRVFRKFRPTLVLAHAPGDYHSDHRAAFALAEAASWQCASTGLETDLPPVAAQPALWLMDTVEMLGFTPGFFIDITDQWEKKQKSLEFHATQLSRGKQSGFSALQEMQARQATTRGAQAGVRAAEAFQLYLAFKRTCAF